MSSVQCAIQLSGFPPLTRPLLVLKTRRVSMNNLPTPCKGLLETKSGSFIFSSWVSTLYRVSTNLFVARVPPWRPIAGAEWNAGCVPGCGCECHSQQLRNKLVRFAVRTDESHPLKRGSVAECRDAQRTTPDRHSPRGGKTPIHNLFMR